jgi:hypothetical protein
VAPDALLKLRAADADDLAVISAIAQDALISVKDLTYDRAAQRFTLVANRFRWETRPDGRGNGEPPYERTLCALTFEAVENVAYRGFRRRDDERILSLLTIRAIEAPNGNGCVLDLEFSGGATVRLSMLTIRVYAADIGEAWPTTWQPDHDANEAR